jgi:predicted PurR-regulated permease PerM
LRESDDGVGGEGVSVARDRRLGETTRLAVAAGALVLLHLLQWALLPFVLAGILAFLCDPAISALSRRTRAPRWAAALLVFLLVFGALGALAFGVGTGAYAEVRRLMAQGLSPLRDELARLLGPTGAEVFGARLTADGLIGRLEGLGRRFAAPHALPRLAPALLAATAGLALFLVAALYAMVSGPALVAGALALAPTRRRPAMAAALGEAGAVLRRYYMGVLMVVAFTGLAAFAGYGLVLRLPGAGVLSLALAVLETVPVAGPLVSALLVALAALQLGSLAALAGMVIYAALLRLVIDDLVAPVALGRSTLIHPLVVMLAYVVGAALFGVIGLLLATPVAGLAKIWLRRRVERLDAEAAVAAAPPEAPPRPPAPAQRAASVPEAALRP